MFKRCSGLWLAVIALLGTDCASPPLASNITVDRFEARMVVDARGSAEVEETWVLRATGGGDAWLRRVVPVGRHDGLTQMRAALDDRPVDPDPDGAVTWRLAGGAPHTARLRYIAAAVVEVSGGRGKVTWRALESSPAPVGEAHLALALPDVMSIVDQPGVVEPGWRVSPSAREVVATRSSIAQGEWTTLVADLSIDAGTMPRPVWQEYKERGTFLVPAFISGGMFIVVVGLGVVVMVLAQRRTWTANDQAGIVRNLTRAGVASVVLSGLLAVATPKLLGHYGVAPMAMPISIALVGLLFAVTGQVLKRRSSP